MVRVPGTGTTCNWCRCVRYLFTFVIPTKNLIKIWQVNKRKWKSINYSICKYFVTIIDSQRHIKMQATSISLNLVFQSVKFLKQFNGVYWYILLQ